MSILVLCEQTMFRDGLGLILKARLSQTDIHFAESAAPGDLLRQAPFVPRVILFDLALATDITVNPISALREAYPLVPIVGLADDRLQPAVERCLKAGARLCVLKSASADVLVAAIQLASSEAICLPVMAPAGLERLESEIRTPGRLSNPTPADLGLTPKQSRVLELLLQGKSAKSIARELGLCTGTVKTHTTAVLRALNVNTRVQAVLAARQMGLQVGYRH